jgi:hypothetical protein
VIAAARPTLSDAESRELEELLAEYGDIFVTKSDKYGQTEPRGRKARLITDVASTALGKEEMVVR